MSLTINVPDDIARAVEARARATGESAETLLIEALQAHFGPVSPTLQAELDAWDRASDEDAEHVERFIDASQA